MLTLPLPLPQLWLTSMFYNINTNRYGKTFWRQCTWLLVTLTQYAKVYKMNQILGVLVSLKTNIKIKLVFFFIRIFKKINQEKTRIFENFRFFPTFLKVYIKKMYLFRSRAKIRDLNIFVFILFFWVFFSVKISPLLYILQEASRRWNARKSQDQQQQQQDFYI